MTVQKQMHVLIIGAGSTGLLIAQGLKQAGISYAIYERTNEDTYKGRQRDWSMSLHWGVDVLRGCLPEDLANSLHDAEVSPWIQMTPEQERIIPIYDGTNAELLANAPTSSSRRASKEKLRKLLRRGIEVNYSKKLVGVKDNGVKVTATFDDGTEAVGDLLVGADSAGSFVRTWLLGAEKAALSEMPMNLAAKYTAEQATFLLNSLHPQAKMGLRFPTNYMFFLATLDLADPNDPTTWVFHLFVTEWSDAATPATSEARLAHLKKIGADFCEPWRSATEWLGPDTFVPLDKLKQWTNPTPWDNHSGRITLAGDAAHAMVPHRGQGLNNALQDAANYIKAVVAVSKGADLAEEISTYDAEVIERGRAEIANTAWQAEACHNGKMFLNSPLAKVGTARMQKMKEQANADGIENGNGHATANGVANGNGHANGNGNATAN